MKRFLLVAVLACVVVGGALYADAPDFTGVAAKIADTVTVTQQWTGKWQPLGGPYIYTETDTCYAVTTVSGIATMDPGDKLYIGARIIKTNDSVVVDTFIFSTPPGITGSWRQPFVFQYLDTLDSQTDDIDSLFINAACGGSTGAERIFLENVYINTAILDR